MTFNYWEKFRMNVGDNLLLRFIDIGFEAWLSLSQSQCQIRLLFELNVHVDGIEPMSLFLIGNFPQSVFNCHLGSRWINALRSVYWSEESLSLSRSELLRNGGVSASVPVSVSTNQTAFILRNQTDKVHENRTVFSFLFGRMFRCVFEHL